jgi:hypothetical protein
MIMTGILFIILIPIVFTLIALNLSHPSKRGGRSGDGGYYGPYDGGHDSAGSCDTGFGGGDCGGGGGGE